MEDIATLRRAAAHAHEPPVQLLIADDDASARSQLGASIRDLARELVVLEAEDGARAIELGLRRRPDIALLDIDMPRLGGVEAAITLRALQPQMRLGLQSGEAPAHRLRRARDHHLPLFSKLELNRTLDWLHAQVEWCLERRLESGFYRKSSFVCRVCGYGAVRVGAPARCPMCHAESMWTEAPWRHSRVFAAG